MFGLHRKTRSIHWVCDLGIKFEHKDTKVPKGGSDGAEARTWKLNERVATIEQSSSNIIRSEVSL